MLTGAMLETSSAHAYAYKLTDLGSFGDISGAYAISDNGFIVGETYTINTGSLQATLFKTGSAPTTLNPSAYSSYSRAFGVNTDGIAVGSAIFGPTSNHAAAFTANAPAIDLGTLGGASSQANGINNLGQIVGSSNPDANSFARATLFEIGKTPIDLGVLAGGNWSNATAINNLSQIVGASSTYWGNHATLFSIGATPIDLDPLGQFGASSAFGINDSGQIIGTGQSSIGDYSTGFRTVQRALLFSQNASPIDLGDLGGTSSRTNGINSKGLIVGGSLVAGDTEMHAALFDIDTGPTDLNSLIDPLSGWILREATAINSNGDIVGYGVVNGQIRAFLATQIPEPNTIILLLAGICALLTIDSRKNQSINLNLQVE